MYKRIYKAQNETSVIFELATNINNYIIICNNLNTDCHDNNNKIFGMRLSFDGGVTYATDYLVSNNDATMLHIATDYKNNMNDILHGQVYLFNTSTPDGFVTSTGGPSLRYSPNLMYADGSIASSCKTKGIPTHISIQWDNNIPFSGLFTLVEF
jgi:hypothetical protein